MKFNIFMDEINRSLNSKKMFDIDGVDMLEKAYNLTEAKYLKEKKFRLMKKEARKKW